MRAVAALVVLAIVAPARAGRVKATVAFEKNVGANEACGVLFVIGEVEVRVLASEGGGLPLAIDLRSTCPAPT